MGRTAVKRITVISALCLVAIAATTGPAAAAPPLTFSATVGEGQSVSLLATTAACRARPCTYVWDIDGVRAGQSRSLVVALAPGCHEVVLRMAERRFRNPSAARLAIARTVCMAEGDAAASTVGELSEPAPVAPAADTTDGVDGTGGVIDSGDVAPSESAPVETAPAETTSEAPPAETPPADTSTAGAGATA